MKNLTLVIILFIAGNISLKAQNLEIKISGTVKCLEDSKKAIPFVYVYNKNTKKGTNTDTKGEFNINMSKNDTLIFSSVQHLEQIYYIKEGDFFHDKSIEIDMQQDTVWLDVVSVIGLKSYNDFKKEVIALHVPKGDISYTLPTVNKYAKQYKTGEGAIELTAPLTYLFNKINLLGTRSNGKLYQE
jgi:hypothetical protein